MYNPLLGDHNIKKTRQNIQKILLFPGGMWRRGFNFLIACAVLLTGSIILLLPISILTGFTATKEIVRNVQRRSAPVERFYTCLAFSQFGF